MVFDISFDVEFICDKFDKENKVEKNVSLTLPITEKDAEKFLFKFTSPVFMFGNYKVLMKFDSNFIVNTMVIFDDEYSYIVKNYNTILSSILEGYIRMQTMKKIGMIMDFEPPVVEELNYDCES